MVISVITLCISSLVDEFERKQNVLFICIKWISVQALAVQLWDFTGER